MTNIRLLLVLILSLSMFCFTVFSHSGGTDSKGGHHSGSSYHYHHGQPAHQHNDLDNDGILDCPYSFQNSSQNNSSTKSRDILISLLLVFALLFVVLRLIPYLYCRYIDFFNRH